jgi:hypothetical protein
MRIETTLSRARIIAEITLAVLLTQHVAIGAPQGPVFLGSAGSYAILTRSGISATDTAGTLIKGNIGVSPIAGTAITGFGLSLDGTTQFSTSSLLVGKAYAADYAPPTPAKLTAAVSDMQIAYADAKGRSTPDYTEYGSGEISGLTLAPGLYKWGTGVLISTDVTLSGGPNDVWIFQIAGDLTMAGATSVILAGGALPGNIFWQVEGENGVDLGTNSHFEGIILAIKKINMQTLASINGRLYSQTAVTLDANPITEVAAISGDGIRLQSTAALTRSFTDAAGQSVNLTTQTFTVPKSGDTQFYRILAETELTLTNITVSGSTVVIQYN